MAAGQLTDAAVRAAKPQAKPYKLNDGDNLHLYVAQTGARLWRMRYMHKGRERLLSLGQYPAVGLAEARAMRDLARKDIAAGHDAGDMLKRRKLEKENPEHGFEAVARQWYEASKGMWTTVHASDVITSLERDVFPEIGRMSVKELKPQDILAVLRKIESRPAIETAHRVRQRISKVFEFAAGMGLVDSNPAPVVAKALKPIRKRRQPAVVTLKEAREVLQAAEAVPASPITRLALRFLALTVVRPGVVTSLPWSELQGLDDKEPVWRIPAERMKLRLHHKDDDSYDHLVPLPKQALDVIEAIRTMTGRGAMVFPNARFPNRPMSENAMGYLLNRAGYHHRHVPHGWRATFSTIMNERHRADHLVIEAVLAHRPENEVMAAYNRAKYLDRRRELLQEWADDLLKDAAPAAELLNGPRR